jgi:hypothetical protein
MDFETSQLKYLIKLSHNTVYFIYLYLILFVLK